LYNNLWWCDVSEWTFHQGYKIDDDNASSTDDDDDENDGIELDFSSFIISSYRIVPPAFSLEWRETEAVFAEGVLWNEMLRMMMIWWSWSQRSDQHVQKNRSTYAYTMRTKHSIKTIKPPSFSSSLSLLLPFCKKIVLREEKFHTEKQVQVHICHQNVAKVYNILTRWTMNLSYGISDIGFQP